jgi:hypothetical protein
MYNKEACYLSSYGQTLIALLIDRGVKDKDLALEILHILVPENELYNLEVTND